METSWTVQLLPLLALTLAFVTAVPEEKEGNWSSEMGTKNHTDNQTILGVTNNKIMTAQFECYQKIIQTTDESEGPHCNRTWDGWLCWDTTRAGQTVEQNCPDYFQDFDPSEKVYKICEETGHWFVHPESNRIWTNYSLCTHEILYKLQTALNLYYISIIGHTLSIVSLLISLGIFFYFKSLSCQRITLHKNLFFSFVCNSIVTIIILSGAANNQVGAADDLVGCKVAQFIHFYLMVCNYFWMLCEGIYLHTLIVVAVFAEKQHLLWYYLLGWGFPLIPSCIHAVARSLYFDDNCWISSETHLLYIVHGPICVALLKGAVTLMSNKTNKAVLVHRMCEGWREENPKLCTQSYSQVNLFFLLNIVRVLITKLKVTHQAESNLYMKAVRATLILVPLLGIEFVLVPWQPQGRVAIEIFNYVTHILMHYQGLLVATIFCFFNGEVQSVLRRNWNQYMIQFEHSFAHSDGLRSASYTASSSFTDGQSFSFNHDCPSEHLNGKSFSEMENVAFKPEKLYG